MTRSTALLTVVLVTAVAAAQPAFESTDLTLPTMRALIDRYSADRQNLRRFYDAPMSPRRFDRNQR